MHKPEEQPVDVYNALAYAACGHKVQRTAATHAQAVDALLALARTLQHRVHCCPHCAQQPLTTQQAEELRAGLEALRLRLQP